MVLDSVQITVNNNLMETAWYKSQIFSAHSAWAAECTNSPRYDFKLLDVEVTVLEF